jgi:hypothetical protein
MPPTAAKARQMLHDDSAQGHPLTAKQKRYFGMLVGKGRAKKRASSKRRT